MSRLPTGRNRFGSFQYGLNPCALASGRTGGDSFDGRVLRTMVVFRSAAWATANDSRAMSRSSASRTRASSWSTASSVSTHSSGTSAAFPGDEPQRDRQLALEVRLLPLDGRGRQLEVEDVVDVLERPVLDGGPLALRPQQEHLPVGRLDLAGQRVVVPQLDPHPRGLLDVGGDRRPLLGRLVDGPQQRSARGSARAPRRSIVSSVPRIGRPSGWSGQNDGDEDLVHEIVRRVLDHLDLFEDDAALHLHVVVGEARRGHDVGEQVERGAAPARRARARRRRCTPCR